MLVLSSALMASLACVWVVTYAALGLWVSAAIPFAYQVATAISICTFARTRRYILFRQSQLVLPLVLPFALQWSLGRLRELLGRLPLGDHLAAGRARCSSARVRPSRGSWRSPASSRSPPRSTPRSPTARPDIPQGVVVAFFALNILGVAATVFALLQYFVRARERALTDLAAQHRALELEQAKSERLLLNVLPAPIAARLKEHEGVIADDLPAVTVLFADIVGFTPLSERLVGVGAGVAARRRVRALGRARRRARRGEDQDDRRRLHGRRRHPAPARRSRRGDRRAGARDGAGAGATARPRPGCRCRSGSASTAARSSPA